jgi:hydroxymethylpyrimidine pyrophosphatase-like HAD family hydrolase
LASDIDDTLIKWNPGTDTCDELQLARTKKAYVNHSKQMTLAFITGRNLPLVQQIAPLLKGLPIKYLGTKNGQELYINDKNQPATTWIQSLEDTKQNPAWQTRLQKDSHWYPQKIKQVILNFVAQAGFQVIPETLPNRYPTYQKTLPNGEIIQLELPAETYIALKGTSSTLSNTQLDAFKVVVQQAQQALASAGIHSDYIRYNYTRPDKQGNIIAYKGYSLNPKGMSKASLLQYLIELQPQLKAVITAGDGKNDTELLSTPHYQSANQAAIPNYPILSGDRPEMLALLKGTPRLIQVPVGSVQDGIKRQLEAINQTRFSASA